MGSAGGTVPLVLESRSWAQGTFLGATLSSETWPGFGENSRVLEAWFATIGDRLPDELTALRTRLG